jgi:predicted aconitase with swiveling domain
MRETKLGGRGIVGGKCTGEALVSAKPLSFLGGVDPADGKIIERNHDLCGECVKDKVFCFPNGHGSTVGSYVLYALAKRNLAPKAIVNQTADPVVVVGAIIANIPMVDQIDIKRIRTGDLLEVNAYEGSVKVLKRKRS